MCGRPLARFPLRGGRLALWTGPRTTALSSAGPRSTAVCGGLGVRSAPMPGLRTTAGRALPPASSVLAIFGGEIGFDAVEEAGEAADEAAGVGHEVHRLLEGGLEVVAEELGDQGVGAGGEVAPEEVDGRGRHA